MHQVEIAIELLLKRIFSPLLRHFMLRERRHPLRQKGITPIILEIPTIYTYIFGEEKDEFAHHGTADLLDRLDHPMDLQVQRA